MSPMHVEIVGPDRKVWSGEATMVIARTVEGDIGVLAGHAPLLGVLVNGVVEIRPTDGAALHAAVLGGFISVANDEVSILAEHADLAEDIEAGQAEADLRAAQEASDEEAVSKARARLTAASGRLR